MGNLGINIDEIEAMGSYEPLPPGKYLAEVINSEVVPTKAGNGKILKLTFSVLDSEYVGRQVFENLNIENASEKAQAIALGRLSALCQAIGKSGIVNDSTELHEKPLYIAVKIEPATADYAAKNKITNFTPAKEKKKAPKPTETSFEDDTMPF